MFDKGVVQELKTLHPITLLGLSLIMGAVIISCGMIAAAGLLGLAVVFALGRPPEEKPRLITSVASKPKHIRGSVASHSDRKARHL